MFAAAVMAFFQSHTLWVNHLADGVAGLVLDCPEAPTNTLNGQVLSDLEEALDRVAGAGRFELLVLRSGKPASFCHGLDLELVGSLHAPDDFVALAQRGQSLCEKLARLPFPSVAVIGGACLGAGLELALACDYRVVVDRPGVALGLPQLELGLMPAWGGTWRLPRLIGLEKSVRLLLGTRRLSAREAMSWGLADDLASADDGPPPEFLAQPRKRDWKRFERHTWRQRLLEATAFGWRLLLRGAERILRERLPEGMPVQDEIVQALRLAASSSPEPALEHERQALGRLGASTACRNLLMLQRQRERQRQALARLAEVEHPQHIAFLGAGPTSLTLLFQAVIQGQQVLLRSRDEQHLGVALMQLLKRLEGEARRGALAPAQLNKCLSAIHGTFTWSQLDEIELVLDTTTGPLTEQRTLLYEAAAHAPDDALLACGGAAHPLAALQEGIPNPGRVAGLYFVEPLQRGSVVEVVRTAATVPETERQLVSWTAALGYVPVPVIDRPGRLVLRVLMPALNEAVLLVREGMAMERIDAALRRFGLAHGPLEYLDLLGLDVATELVQALQPLFADRLTFEGGFALMARQGWLGVQAGRGFYHYRGGQKHGVHTQAERLWRQHSQGEAAHELPPLSVPDQYRMVRDRLVALMVLEAARCLQEGIVADAEALDLALCQAFWPSHHGGPLRYARQQQASVASTWQELARLYGARFQPNAAIEAILRPPDKI
jgi:3-hydroxyacyl-CoA dehydrogenase/enoyl-CoA hydratase/3-hydroxybutyryl-CoA epimerase